MTDTPRVLLIDDDHEAHERLRGPLSGVQGIEAAPVNLNPKDPAVRDRLVSSARDYLRSAHGPHILIVDQDLKSAEGLAEPQSEGSFLIRTAIDNPELRPLHIIPASKTIAAIVLGNIAIEDPLISTATVNTTAAIDPKKIVAAVETGLTRFNDRTFANICDTLDETIRSIEEEPWFGDDRQGLFWKDDCVGTARRDPHRLPLHNAAQWWRLWHEFPEIAKATYETARGLIHEHVHSILRACDSALPQVEHDFHDCWELWALKALSHFRLHRGILLAVATGSPSVVDWDSLTRLSSRCPRCHFPALSSRAPTSCGAPVNDPEPVTAQLAWPWFIVPTETNPGGPTARCAMTLAKIMQLRSTPGSYRLTTWTSGPERTIGGDTRAYLSLGFEPTDPISDPSAFCQRVAGSTERQSAANKSDWTGKLRYWWNAGQLVTGISNSGPRIELRFEEVHRE